MAATLTSAPPSKAYSHNPIYATLTTDGIDADNASFGLAISGGPTIGETLEFMWPGGSVVFTVAATTTEDGLSWPAKTGGETNADYTIRLAEFLRQCDELRDEFVVQFSGTNITLTHPIAEVFALDKTSTLTNVTVTANSVTTPATEENLVAFLEVWRDSGSFNGDRILLSQHSPYAIETGSTWFDISSAFAHLAPYLPAGASINPAVPALSRPIATSHWQKYYLRYADKFGVPSRAGALVRSDSYIAILGGRAGDALSTDFPVLRHNYRRRDGLVFRKPVDMSQPDWVYIMPTANAAADIAITIRWSDGTTSSYIPFGVADTPWLQDKIYVVPSGYMQMNLHTQSPSGATDEDAYIVAYDWILASDGGWTVTVRYELRSDTPWEHYLLFQNGMGGMETVALRGKASEAYTVTSEQFTTPRKPGWTAQKGDFGTFAAEGRPTWDFSTGWYDDPFYLEHLKQLPLSDVWLVDVANRRFLKVVMEGATLEEIRKDDETLFSLSLKIKAGWAEEDFNV